jgi:hypothetical protein
MPRLSTCVLLMVALWGGATAAASEAAHRVKVTIVRLESAIHTSLSNHDVYLVQVTRKSGSTFAARMVDEYPSYAETLPVASLSERAIFSVALRRTPYCDVASREQSADQSMRCFAVVHGSWKIPKRNAAADWWR